MYDNGIMLANLEDCYRLVNIPGRAVNVAVISTTSRGTTYFEVDAK